MLFNPALQSPPAASASAHPASRHQAVEEGAPPGSACRAGPSPARHSTALPRGSFTGFWVFSFLNGCLFWCSLKHCWPSGKVNTCPAWYKPHLHPSGPTSPVRRYYFMQKEQRMGLHSCLSHQSHHVSSLTASGTDWVKCFQWLCVIPTSILGEHLPSHLQGLWKVLLTPATAILLHKQRSC